MDWAAWTATVLLLTAATATQAGDYQGADVIRAVRNCRSIRADDERLRCFDGVADRSTPPRFEGRRNAATEPFTIDRPHILRFHSEGVIFVLYLKDAAGNVVQNLHIGGGGEDTYRIEKPGTYSLQINGAEGWRIWLEPQ